ncbi:hypothetical protein V8D89_002690 [Ganoderma adspersum]
MESAIISPAPPSITRLPPELLTAVFAMLSNDKYYTPPETLMHWVRLMLVCHHWRNVGISSPWLWRRVSITTNMESLQYRLSRTVGCTIDVFLSGDSKVNGSAMSLLIPLAHRIRSIDTTDSFHFGNLPSIKPLFQVALPALESVKVIRGSASGFNLEARNSEQSSAWFDLGLSEKLHPRIRRLEVHRIVIPSHPTFFSSLRQMIINLKDIDIHDEDHSLFPQDIINALAHAPHLETLEVCGCYFSWHYPPSPEVPVTLEPATLTQYRLPCLRKLVLKCPYLFVAEVLRVIDAPALTVFHVEASTSSPIVVEDIGSLIFPPSFHYLVQQYTELFVTRGDSGRWGFRIYDVKHKFSKDAYNRNRLHLQVSDLKYRIHPLTAALRTLYTFDITPQVHSLYFADFGASPPRSCTLWDPIHTIFPAIRSITLRHCFPDTVAFFLRNFLELSEKGAWSDLQDLYISTSADPTPTSYGVHAIADLVLRAARVRAERGAPLTLIELEHDVLLSTPLVPHRWTLWGICRACRNFDFKIYHGRCHIPRRLGQLFTFAEQQRLMDGTWDTYEGSDEAADEGTQTAEEESSEENEDGIDECLVSALSLGFVWDPMQMLTECSAMISQTSLRTTVLRQLLEVVPKVV